MSVMLVTALISGNIDTGVLAEETALSKLSVTDTELPERDSEAKSQQNQENKTQSNLSGVENLDVRTADIISDSAASMLSNFEPETRETSKTKSELVSSTAAEIKAQVELNETANVVSEVESSNATETSPGTESFETPEAKSTSETSEISKIKNTSEASEQSTISSNSEDSAIPATSGTILEILDSDTLSALDPVVIVQNTSENNDALLMRILQLQSVTARVRTADGEETTIRLSVDWNVGRLDLPQIDVSVAGEYEEIGTIVFPDDYTCAEGVLQQLHLPVHVVLPDIPIVLTKVAAWPAGREAYAVPAGSDLSDFPSTHLSQFWNCYDASDTLYQATIQWDTSSVDTSVPGLYWLTGTLTAPEHTVFAETLSVPVFRIPVSVQDPEKPDINCIFQARGMLCIPLAGLPGDPAQIRILLCAQGNTWTDITDSDHCQVSSDAIYLSNDLFALQETYKLQVTYKGGKTGILTFLFDEALEHFQYSGGDRDGGDSGTGKDDDRVQPAPELPETEQTEPEQSETFQPGATKTETETPESPSEPSSPSAADHTEANPESNPTHGQTFTEHFTSDYDRISGTRLLLTLETSGCAQFSKHGISITIPKAALDALSIAREDFFRITILQQSDDTFSFFFEKNETDILTLSSVRIMLPWSGDAGCGLILLDEQRHIVAYGSCDADSHIASFVTDRTGTFQIVPDDGTVATLATLIDTCRNSFLQQMSRHPFWLLCF